MSLTEKQEHILTVYDCPDLADMLSVYPIRYEQFTEKPYSMWQPGDVVLFEAQLVSSIRRSYIGGKRSIEKFTVIHEDNEIQVTTFNRRFLNARFFRERIVLVAKVEDAHRVTALNMNAIPLEQQRGIKAIYPLKDGVKQHEVKRLVDKALKQCNSEPDIVPDEFRESYKLLHHQQAVKWIHHPPTQDALKQALRTLKYEEFLIYQARMALEKQANLEIIKAGKIFDRTLINQVIGDLPYQLTNDQLNALQEILGDMESGQRMNRLLQGDVGSGKTIVVFLAAYAAILSGQQAVLMVPTEILAVQHMNNARKLLTPYGVNIALLTQSTSQRSQVQDDISSGKIDFIIGTHTLFQDDLEFYDCGLVITDEQHRFGVNQRQKLEEKGNNADQLMLSATPIPRTLANVLYANLDVSTITEYPANRKINDTYYIRENSLRSILSDLNDALAQGTQIYVVCPAVDENELGLKNVEDIYQQLIKVFPSHAIAKIYGKMNAVKKQEVMHDFVLGKIQLLISTTVIEVGVDVKNANIMIIYNAERFGLSTLHQLRGRVGRGDQQGICYLLSGSKDPLATKRLESLVENHDGFALAMEDLKLRGPGDLVGVRQSGLPLFILGDFYQDQKIMDQAMLDAKILIARMAEPQVRNFFSKIAGKEKNIPG